MTRTQLKSWLCASSAFVAFAFAHAAQAAHSTSAATAPSPSSPKTGSTSVKRLPEEIQLPRLSLPRLRLELAEPRVLPPPRAYRHEILWLGMRIPTLIAFGLSGVSAGGAVATGFAATRGNDPSTCDSRCAEHGVRQRALLLTTGLLTGVAAAGLSVGITFMLKEPKDPKADAIRPRFDLGVSGQKAIAKVGWVFSSF